jgi:hypothetical protein
MTPAKTDAPGRPWRARDYGLLALIFLVALAPMAATPVLPFIDFYNHIARYFIMAHIGVEPDLAQNYAVHWALLPNLGLDVIGTGLMLVLPPMIVPHVIGVLLLAIQFTGVLALHRALGGRSPLIVGLLSAGLLYSYILTWGFSNFLLGLGIGLLAAALWLATRRRPWLSLIFLAPLAVVIFMIHAFAFGLYGLIVAGLAFGLWLNSTPRRLAGLVELLAPVAAQAVAPAILFLRTPTAATAGGAIGGSIGGYAGHPTLLVARVILEIQHRVTTVVRVAEGPSMLFDAVIFGIVALGFLYLATRRQASLHRAAWPALAALSLLFLVIPPALFGVGYVADRIPLAIALVLVSATETRLASLRERRTVFAVLIALTALRIGAITVQWSGYRQTFDAFRTAAATIPKDALVTGVIDAGVDVRDGFRPHCEMYAPLTVLLRGAMTPVFAEATKQPISLIGPLATAVGQSGPRPNLTLHPDRFYYDDTLAQVAAQQRFDYVVLCGRSRLQRALPPNLVPVGDAGPVEILQVVRSTQPPAGSP